MYAFEWHRASSVADASAALARTGGRPLAGGQSLIAAMRLRLAQPGTLVDLSGIRELYGIRASTDALTIGAMTRHADVAASEDVKRTIPALAALADSIGDQQIRNMGTIGGSIANNDPAADWPGGLVALGGWVTTSKRTIPADWPGGAGRARRMGDDEQAHDPGRHVLHRTLRDGARER